jgi:prephenate dehydratase
MLDGHFTAVQFYIDAETHVESPAFALALEELQFFCPQDAVTVLGCYPADAARYDTGGKTR